MPRAAPLAQMPRRRLGRVAYRQEGSEQARRGQLAQTVNVPVIQFSRYRMTVGATQVRLSSSWFQT